MVFKLHFSNTAQLLKKSCTAITQHYTAVNYSIYTAVFIEVKTGHICVILIKFVSKTPFSICLVWKPAFSSQVLSISAHQNCVQKKLRHIFFRCELFSSKVKKTSKIKWFLKKKCLNNSVFDTIFPKYSTFTQLFFNRCTAITQLFTALTFQYSDTAHSTAQH